MSKNKSKKKDEIIALPCMEEARKFSQNPAIVYRDAIKISDQMKSYCEGKTYFIKTFGCQANVRDSEIMAGMFELAGMKETTVAKEANFIIVNTCAVRENAVDKMYGEIGNLKSLAKTADIIAVCGCVVEQPTATERIRKIYPQVNLIFGTHELPLMFDYIEKVLFGNAKKAIAIKSQTGDVFEDLPSKRDSTYKAFVNIMYGCNKFCTYCIVPYTRGRERSRLPEDIIKECQELIDAGYQEITLLGQNVNAYGKDLKNGIGFAELLEKVALLGIPRLRFTTPHPWDFDDKMIDIIAKYPNIMKSVHLPVQSGNDEILMKMGRRYDSAHYKDLVDRMKARIPGLTLSTDIIVGFPNETYEQFADTLKMVNYVKYESAFTFIYSPRPGTPAARLKDDVSDEEKHRRFDELVKTCEVHFANYANSMVGKVYKVLVDGPSKNNDTMYSGYTECNKVVHFRCEDKSIIGTIVKVKILESHTYSLIGELYEEK